MIELATPKRLLIGRPRGSETATRSDSRPTMSSERTTRSSSVQGAASGRAPPASSSDRSSRFPTSRSRRFVSIRIDSRSSSRSVFVNSSVWRLSAAARIAVSGERRSWLTERRTAVLAASLRLNVSASSALARSRSRSRATARSEASAGRSRAAVPGSMAAPAGRNSLPTCLLPAWRSRADSFAPGRRRESSSIRPPTTPKARAASSAMTAIWLGTSSACSSAAEARASTLASRSRCSASAARRRARAASSLTTIAVKRYTASATQFSDSRSEKVCVGGRKNQLKASMLSTDTPTASVSPKRTATGKTAKR